MFNKTVSKISLAIIVLLSIISCDMDLQSHADYDSSVLDPHINMTAWEYFESRSDIFSMYMEAIEHAEMKEYFTQTTTKYTFLALTNEAMDIYTLGIFSDVDDTIVDIPKEEVAAFIQYHIVEGEYSSYGKLDIEPIHVLTLREGATGLMTMMVRKRPWHSDAGKIVVNDTGSNFSSPSKSAVSSNIMPTNGVLHVFNEYCSFSR